MHTDGTLEPYLWPVAANFAALYPHPCYFFYLSLAENCIYFIRWLCHVGKNIVKTGFTFSYLSREKWRNEGQFIRYSGDADTRMKNIHVAIKLTIWIWFYLEPFWRKCYTAIQFCDILIHQPESRRVLVKNSDLICLNFLIPISAHTALAKYHLGESRTFPPLDICTSDNTPMNISPMDKCTAYQYL